MADNPFAKYAQEENPFAKYTVQTEDPGVMGTLLIGAGRTFDRVGKGMQQLYYGAKSQFEDPTLSSLVLGGTPSQLALKKLKQQAEDDDAAYKPLQELRPFATGIGESLPSVVLPAGGATTLLGNAGRMALSAAVPAALEYGDAGERAARAATAGVSAAAVPVLGIGLKTAKSLVEPLYGAGRETIAGRTLSRVAGADAPNVISRLNAGAPLIPGSLPTAAQLAENGGIAALERMAGAANPTPYAQRSMEQASARLSALRGIAGDDAKMAAAVAAREAASKPLYDAAGLGIAPIDSMFKGLQMRPQFQAAIDRAQTLAKDKGLNDIFFRDQAGKPLALIGEGAHFIKKALDEAGEYGSASYTGKQSASAAGETNKIFQKWLDQSIPEYGAAKSAFEAGSKPINQMQVGQALLEKARPALADFGALGRETGATYANALRHGDAVAASATGFPGATMASVLTPQQLQTVNNVARDLARKSNSQDIGRGVGSDTFQKMSVGNIAQQSGMPGIVGGLLSLPGVSRATNWIYRDTDQKLQDMLAESLLDPKKTAALMTGSQPILSSSPVARQLLEQSLIRGGGLLGMSAVAQP